MKKHFITFAAIAVAMTGLIGCGNETNSPSSTETTKPSQAEGTTSTTETIDGKIPIKLWLDYDVYAEEMEKIIEEKFPNIDINWEHVESTQTRSKLELDGPAGIGPDIFIQPHDNMAQSIQGNILLPLGTDLVSKVEGRFIESAVETVKSGDQYYGIPLSTESIALFYNKTLLDEYGFDVATSFEEIKAQGAVFNNTAKNKFIIRI